MACAFTAGRAALWVVDHLAEYRVVDGSGAAAVDVGGYRGERDGPGAGAHGRSKTALPAWTAATLNQFGK